MKTIQMVPIEQVRIINSRARSDAKFQDMVSNISKVGLKKPITISRRVDGEGYDLVCGQGRLEAYIALGQTEVPALLVDAPLHDRYLMSLVENLARPRRTTLQLAREITALKDRGYTTADIATKVGLSGKYVADLVRLVEKGEERLVTAVERGDVPIGVAIEIATSNDDEMQRNLTEAYESGKLKGKALLKVRRLMDRRRVRGRSLRGESAPKKRKPASADDLLRSYQRETQKQEQFVKRAHATDRQLRFIVSAVKQLFEDEELMNVIRAESLDGLPKYIAESIGK